MSIWQIFPLVLFAGVVVVVFLMRAKLGPGARRLFDDGIATVSAAATAARLAGESEPACIMATTRSAFGGKVFFLALTDRRLFVAEAGKPPRGFARDALAMTVERKRWTDVGNMQTTTSEGWEARVALPDSGKHVWRIYETADPTSIEGRNVTAFLRSVGAPSA